MPNTTYTYTNGNRQIEITNEAGRFAVQSHVFDGVKWQTGQRKTYKTERAAEKEARKRVDAISSGWTQFPEWTIEHV